MARLVCYLARSPVNTKGPSQKKALSAFLDRSYSVSLLRARCMVARIGNNREAVQQRLCRGRVASIGQRNLPQAQVRGSGFTGKPPHSGPECPQ
jgi:hypothetical protein